ncbi:hypothetical protein EDD18DRAFT_1115621 [Armillaria luteobubalina]|uniref:Uncharacterized protein n=1 Tax=Armillaria luteobubalina TaxID=153913 RepID=A0AA39TAI8_9AGAR|nr:hypothetical protein EDD18DRAFT_1115621 [Armillaria luteobubalina]
MPRQDPDDNYFNHSTQNDVMGARTWSAVWWLLVLTTTLVNRTATATAGEAGTVLQRMKWEWMSRRVEDTAPDYQQDIDNNLASNKQLMSIPAWLTMARYAHSHISSLWYNGISIQSLFWILSRAVQETRNNCSLKNFQETSRKYDLFPVSWLSSLQVGPSQRYAELATLVDVEKDLARKHGMIHGSSINSTGLFLAVKKIAFEDETFRSDVEKLDRLLDLRWELTTGAPRSSRIWFFLCDLSVRCTIQYVFGKASQLFP